MASEDNTILQNVLCIFKEYYFQECVLYSQMRIHMKLFGHEYKGCAKHCLPDIIH